MPKGRPAYFDPKVHQYHRSGDGARVRSVTQILAAGGIVDASWYGGVEYLDRGTMLHALTAKMDRGEKFDLRRVPKRWRGFLPAWPKFRAETGFTPVEIECPVFSEGFCPMCRMVHEYGGTFDRLGYFKKSDRLLTMLDLKNQNQGRVCKWVAHQLVGYGHAWDPKRLFRRVGVALHPNGTYAVTEFKLTSWDDDLREFLEAHRRTLDADRWMKFRRGRR